MDWTILWWLLTALIVIAGLAGTVVPALPGVPLVFAGLFLGAWIDGFQIVGWATIGVLAVLTLIAVIVDFVASAAGAVVGMFFGLPGMLLGPFVGAVLGELGAGRDLLRSGRAGIGAWLGMVVATALKLAIAFLMIGLFLFRLGFEHIAAGT